MSSREKIRILFVCMGNICRSPTAEGVFRKLLQTERLTDRIAIDSAGTHDYHIGRSPDTRACRAAATRDIDITDLRGRQIDRSDFDQFDRILVMDRSNYEDVMAICPPGKQAMVELFLDYAPDVVNRDVPDPYYGGADGFERVLDMVESASRGLLDDLKRNM